MEKLHRGISINTASKPDGNSCKNFYRLSRTHTHRVSVVLQQLDASQFAYCQVTGGKQHSVEREGGGRAGISGVVWSSVAVLLAAAHITATTG